MAEKTGQIAYLHFYFVLFALLLLIHYLKIIFLVLFMMNRCKSIDNCIQVSTEVPLKCSITDFSNVNYLALPVGVQPCSPLQWVFKSLTGEKRVCSQ